MNDDQLKRSTRDEKTEPSIIGGENPPKKRQTAREGKISRMVAQRMAQTGSDLVFLFENWKGVLVKRKR